MKKFLAVALMIAVAFGLTPFAPSVRADNNPSVLSYVAGSRVASNYVWRGLVVQGNTGTGTQTYTIGFNTTLPDGRTFLPFGVPPILTPVSFDMGANQETITPTTVSYTSCPTTGQFGPQISCVSFTGSFTFAHGTNSVIASGSAGLQEAINDAFAAGGGIVVVDPTWKSLGGTNAMITAAVVLPNTSVADFRIGVPRYWNATPTGLALAAPTLPAINIAGQAACDATHQMCSDATVAGSASWGGTVHACWAYVDIFGNEGPCSADTSWTSVASKAIDLGIPAASPGAVGAVPYLSLSGGSYALAYQIPVTATVCTMTTLETITPACAVANTTFNQAGSTFGAGGLFTTGGAQITTFPVNTSQVAPILATTAATLAAQHTFTNSSVTYAYAPGARTGACGASSSNIVQQNAAGGINGSSATTVPNPIASWTIPANCFNFIGAEFRVTGKFTYTDGGDTSTHLIVAWDSNVTDTASVPTPLCDVLDTATGTGAAYNGTYTCTVRILTTGASGTAVVNGYSTQSLAAGATTLVRNSADKAVAASAAIDLAVPARITVWFEGIGATNNPGAQGLDATLEVLN